MMKNTPKITVDFLIGMNPEALHSFIHQNYAGTDNRFRRQDLIKEITGLTIPLVKCGISHLREKIEAFRLERSLTAQSEPSVPANELEVGTPVIRKKCGRKGVIKANVNGKLEIELEDGNVRKPASKRFASLYNFQTA